ncbi:uncharacterized protein IL334_000631 [Kwoniella shivajii]|uniref:Asl1-like glycosyl hydrolase catalytic domain-containing protein n=1 Tax=Kwoniella shivajii TaxID=564305 RepID=A0ABZ1CPV5_9TREE|nr:hypothetical protein IL334_000631 [Kwoniella shivajii]
MFLAQQIVLAFSLLSSINAARHKRSCKVSSSIEPSSTIDPNGLFASSLDDATSLNRLAAVQSIAVTSAMSGSSTTIATSTTTTASSSNTASNEARAAGKAGIGWPAQEKDAAPVSQFFSPNSTVSWWFDWNKNWNQGVLTSDGVQVEGEFIPMIFGANYLNNSDTFQEGFTEVMGYNEPDHKSDTVSQYMEPSEAAEVWKTQIVQIHQQYPNVKIHSPVMASNRQWLIDWFDAICPDNSASDGWGDCEYKPDYVSAHMYNTNVEYFKNTLTSFQKDFGLPLILSEFACHEFSDNPPQPSTNQVSAFMQETMEWLDQQEWVVKYAWFGVARDLQWLFGVYETNRLMDTAGTLTSLGRQYMNGGKKA